MLVKFSIFTVFTADVGKNFDFTVFTADDGKKIRFFTVFPADVGKKIDVVKTPAVKPCIIDIIVTSLQRWFKKS